MRHSTNQEEKDNIDKIKIDKIKIDKIEQDIVDQIKAYQWRACYDWAKFLPLGPFIFYGVAAQELIRECKDSLTGIRIIQLKILLDIIGKINDGEPVDKIEVDGWKRDELRESARAPYIVRDTDTTVTLSDIIQQLGKSNSKKSLGLAERIKKISKSVEASPGGPETLLNSASKRGTASV